MEINQKELELLKRLVSEIKLWPGAEETPHGVPLSEEDDQTLIALIEKIKATALKK